MFEHCRSWRAATLDPSQRRSWAYDEDGEVLPPTSGFTSRSITAMPPKIPSPSMWGDPARAAPFLAFTTPQRIQHRRSSSRRSLQCLPVEDFGASERPSAAGPPETPAVQPRHTEAKESMAADSNFTTLSGQALQGLQSMVKDSPCTPSCGTGSTQDASDVQHPSDQRVAGTSSSSSGERMSVAPAKHEQPHRSGRGGRREWVRPLVTIAADATERHLEGEGAFSPSPSRMYTTPAGRQSTGENQIADDSGIFMAWKKHES